jgi:hypothetical protein
VPFLKFSRDRRGYEHIYLVEPVSGRHGKTYQRVLYWFRTPPNVKVGRAPFDDQVMRALEARYPGIKFDWETLRNTPIPAVEPEYWRERRRADRAARRVRDEDQQQEDTGAQEEAGVVAAGDPPAPEPAAATDGQRAEIAAAAIAESVPGTSTGTVMAPGRGDAGAGNSPRQRRRRRRRGQRHRGPDAGSAPGTPGQTGPTAGPSIDSGNVPVDAPNDGPEDI